MGTELSHNLWEGFWTSAFPSLQTFARTSGVSNTALWGITGLTVPAQSASPHNGVAQVVLGVPGSLWPLPMHPMGTFPLCPAAEAQG